MDTILITTMLIKLKVMETKKLTKEEFLEKLKTDRDFNNRSYITIGPLTNFKV